MDSHKTHDFLQVCTHLKSEWQPIQSTHSNQNIPCYQHVYSQDQSQSRLLTSVTMKDLDQYSKREAYTFPFCPRIYKYSIEKNHQKGNELIFDIILLVQRVSQRLNNELFKTDSKTFKMLSNKIIDIVKGFEYLFRRFGSFAITEEMIGWTKLGIVKVWINEDFCLNYKQFSSESESTMVSDLIRILQEQNFLRKYFKNCDSFQNLLYQLEHMQERKDSDMSKKHVVFRPIDNFNMTVNICQEKQKMNKTMGGMNSPQSKKNITFSYSNKDLDVIPPQVERTEKNKPISTIAASKRCSIEMDSNELSHLQLRPALRNEFSGLKIGTSKTPSSLSSKLIEPMFKRREKKQLSYFKLETNDKKDDYETEMNGKSHFSTQSTWHQQQVPKNEARLCSNIKSPESLKYSTSSNPLSNFFRNRRKEEKTYSSKGNNSILSKQDELELETISRNDSASSQFSRVTLDNKLKEETRCLLETFKIEEQESNLRQSQEVQNDLDALFNSNHEFDYDQLENELDCIL